MCMYCMQAGAHTQFIFSCAMLSEVRFRLLSIKMAKMCHGWSQNHWNFCIEQKWGEGAFSLLKNILSYNDMCIHIVLEYFENKLLSRGK